MHTAHHENPLYTHTNHDMRHPSTLAAMATSTPIPVTWFATIWTQQDHIVTVAVTVMIMDTSDRASVLAVMLPVPTNRMRDDSGVHHPRVGLWTSTTALPMRAYTIAPRFRCPFHQPLRSHRTSPGQVASRQEALQVNDGVLPEVALCHTKNLITCPETVVPTMSATPETESTFKMMLALEDSVFELTPRTSTMSDGKHASRKVELGRS